MSEDSGKFRIIKFIDAINKISSGNKASLISTFDFSALYANIPHYKLKSAMRELLISISKMG